MRLAEWLIRLWPLLVAFLCALIAMSLGMSIGIERLIDRWNFAYGHWFLVIGMSAYLLIAALGASPVERVGPSLVGVLGIALVVPVYWFSELLDFTLGMQVLLPILLLALVHALGGWNLCRAAIIPIGFLYFAIPIWDLAVRPLQLISISAVSWGLSIAGPPAHLEGTHITIPYGIFEIAGGCSGMRYFMVALSLAAFYGLAFYRSWTRRLILFAVAGLAAMVSNWIRIYTLILIGNATEMQHYLIVESHDAYGWLVFVVSMVPVLFLAKRMEPTASLAEASEAPVVAAGAPYRASALSFFMFGGVASALISVPAITRGDQNIPDSPVIIELVPESDHHWTRLPPAPEWQPAFQSPYLEVRQTMGLLDAPTVALYVGRYEQQQPGSKLLAAGNELHPGWEITGSRTRVIESGSFSRQVTEVDLSSSGSRRQLWTWYIIGGKPVADPVRAKLSEFVALMRGRRDGAIVGLSANCELDCDAALSSMGRFVADFGARLESIANSGSDPVSVELGNGN